jgi:hypothetical protein
MRQIEKEPKVDAISLDNIDILSKWRVEIEVPLLDEAPAWLEEGDQEQQHQQEDEEDEEEEEEEEEIHPYTMEDDELVESGTPLSTHIGVASPTPSSIDVRPRPSASSSRPGKQPLILSRKRGRGH